MTPKQFFDKVSEMRNAQRKYFKTRSQSILEQSKQLEREIDQEIERVNSTLSNKQQPIQGDLFNS